MNVLYTVLGVLASLGGLLAWIYNLIKSNQTLKETVASKDAQKKFQEWADQIKAIEDKVKEDERDYEQLKKDALSGSSGNSDDSGKS